MAKTGWDHSPISYTLDPIDIKCNFPFRFEKMWTSHMDIFLYILEWWNIHIEGSAMFKVAKKLRNVKLNIRKWNKLDFGNIFHSKAQILEDLGIIQDVI